MLIQPTISDQLTQIVARKKELLPIQGQNGQTWIAEDPALQCDVVLKEIELSDDAKLRSVLGECRKMERARHPYVAEIRCVGRDVDRPIARIVMPLYKNGCLEQAMIDSSGPIPLARALRYGEHVLLALSYTHSQNLLHADLKPSNVLIGNNGEGILTDFGQSEVILSTGPAPGMARMPLMYGYNYPPEAFTSYAADVTLDIYQAGLLLYRLVNGPRLWKQQIILAASRIKPGTISDPYTDQKAWAMSKTELEELITDKSGNWYTFTRLIVNGKWPVRNLWLPHVPAGLRRVIKKALSLDPANRYQSAEEMKEALNGVSLNQTIGDCVVRDEQDGWVWTHTAKGQMYSSYLTYANNRWTLKNSAKNITSGAERQIRKHSGTFVSLDDSFKALEVRLKEVR